MYKMVTRTKHSIVTKSEIVFLEVSSVINKLVVEPPVDGNRIFNVFAPGSQATSSHSGLRCKLGGEISLKGTYE